MIRSASSQALKFNLVVDDGTAQIEVQVWAEAGHEDKSSRWREGSYVRVVGHLRTGHEPSQRNFLSDWTKIRPIEEYNEITYHMLEAVNVHLQNLRQTGEGG